MCRGCIGLNGGAAGGIGKLFRVFAHAHADGVDLLDNRVGNRAHGFGAGNGDVGGFLQVGGGTIEFLGDNTAAQTEFVRGGSQARFDTRGGFAHTIGLFLDHGFNETQLGHGAIWGRAEFLGLNGQGFFDDLHAAEHAFHDLIEVGGLLTQAHVDLGRLIFDAVAGGGEFGALLVEKRFETMSLARKAFGHVGDSGFGALGCVFDLLGVGRDGLAHFVGVGLGGLAGLG